MKAIAITSATIAFALGIRAAEIPKAPIPPSPYLPVIYKFADAMLEKGRDTNGLFYSALDRVTVAPLTNRFPALEGVREQDRALTRGNSHQNLLRLLYTLSELSGKAKYREAADAEVRWFVEDTHGSRPSRPLRPWMLWDRCFTMAPKASETAARLLRAETERHSARRVGFEIRAWAAAYAHTKNENFLGFIARPLERFEQGRGSDVLSMLSLTIDCDAASHLVPPRLASTLQAFVKREDELLPLAGWLKISDGSVTGGGRPIPMWTTNYGENTTAQIGMMCVSRYENTGNIAYRDLIHAAADAYLKSMPSPDEDVWPMTFGHAISLQVASWRSTANPIYLDRARAFADFALKHFFDKGPLPRASLKSNHYEAITGADTLALGLVELHLHILAITAVRYPSNTIDR